MKRATARYDLILFGLLDSHTQLSDYANMRLDNFVYTEESFREARALLAPNGILFIKFQINHPFVGRRLDEMLTRTFGKAPVVFLAPSNYTAAASCFVISPSGQVEARLAADSRLSQFVAAERPAFLTLPEVAVTTDDWPYLYHQGHWIPEFSTCLAHLLLCWRRSSTCRFTKPGRVFLLYFSSAWARDSCCWKRKW